MRPGRIRSLGLLYRAALAHRRESERAFQRYVDKLGPPDMFRAGTPLKDYLFVNGYSIFFYAQYMMAGFSSEERTLFGVLNNCMRMLVTGTDNLLDKDNTHLLENRILRDSPVMSSVLDLLLAEKIISTALLDGALKQELFSVDLIPAVQAALLERLALVGVNESEEIQSGQFDFSSSRVLNEVHHYKSGLLFTLPLLVPLISEGEGPRLGILKQLEKAVYEFGIGVQILDDLSDLGEDFRERKPNYCLSVFRERGLLDALAPQLPALTRGAMPAVADQDENLANALDAILLEASGRIRGSFASFQSLHGDFGKGTRDFIIGQIFRKLGIAELRERFCNF